MWRGVGDSGDGYGVGKRGGRVGIEVYVMCEVLGAEEGIRDGEEYSRRGDVYMCFFFQAEGGIRDAQESRGLGDVYKRQALRSSDTVSATPSAAVGSSRRINLFAQCVARAIAIP